MPTYSENTLTYPENMLTDRDRYKLGKLLKKLYKNCCQVDLRVTDPCRKRDHATNQLKKAVTKTFVEYEGMFSEYADEVLQQFENQILDSIPHYVEERRRELSYSELREAPKRKIRISPVAAGAAAGFAIPAAAGIYSLVSKDPAPLDAIYSFLYNIGEAVKEAVSAGQSPVFAQPPSFLEKLFHEEMIFTSVGTAIGAVIGAARDLKPDSEKRRQHATLKKELREMLES